MPPSLRKSDTLHTVLAIAVGSFLAGILFWHGLGTNPMWAITSFVLVYDPDMRAALSTAGRRLSHTLLGAVIAVTMIGVFGVYKWVLPVSLSVAALICGLLLNFGNSWRVVLLTVCLIVGSTLAEPGTNDLQVAWLRALEVTVGSVMAIGFSWVVARVQHRDPADPAT